MEFQTFKDLVLWIVGLINLAVPVVAGIALLTFLWGLARFLSRTGDPQSNADGRSLMIWGVVALAVMISYMGLIGIAQTSLGLPEHTVLPLIKPSS